MNHKPKYKYEIMHDRWVGVYQLINGTHYEWVRDFPDMEAAKKFTGEK